jgi:two-component system, NtrC family, sensor kinase
MKLYQQLILFMLAATVLPLAVVGFWLLRTSEDELGAHIRAEQQALGVLVAREAATQLVGTVDALGRATEAIDWAGASAEEIRGALSLLYQQSSAVAAVALVDSEGALLNGPVFRGGADGHPFFSGDRLPALVGAVPLGALRGGALGQAALSPAYPEPTGAPARMAVAIKAGDGENAPFVLAEIALDSLDRELRDRADSARAEFELLDGKGRIVASSDERRRFQTAEPEVWGKLGTVLAGSDAASFSTAAEPERVVSAARVPNELGLYAVVSRAQADALAPVRRMRRTVLFALGAALAVLLTLGAVFTRRLNRRIGRVVQGAEAYRGGDLSWRIPVSGADELAHLSDTFNRMGAELEAARTRLLQWNDELRQKVEEATADLRSAQAQLVEAQKLAAIGQLGAGVAHEINNPLAGILGNAQLLMLERSEQDPDFESLRKIEQSAKRCKEITQNLLRFSQQRDRPELRPVNLNSVVRDALALTENQIKGEAIALRSEMAGGRIAVTADPGHLSQVILALVSNARTAMMKTERKELLVRTGVDGAEAVVVVQDTGKGISPEHLPRIFEPFFTTKDVWSNVGLGLSVAYRVMSEHGGRIEVKSEPGRGTAVMLRLPLHLAEKEPVRTAA